MGILDAKRLFHPKSGSVFTKQTKVSSKLAQSAKMSYFFGFVGAVDSDIFNPNLIHFGGWKKVYPKIS